MNNLTDLQEQNSALKAENEELKSIKGLEKAINQINDNSRISLSRACSEERLQRLALEKDNVALRKDLTQANLLNQKMREAMTKIEFYSATGCLQDSFDEIKRMAREALESVVKEGKE